MRAIRVDGISKQYTIRNPEAPGWPGRLTAWARPRPPRQLTVHALREVCFEVEEGQIFGVIGRNGAGKSTLLKILSRITTPTGGRAEIRGRVASLLEVGTGFHPELTGRENVFLNGMLLGMRRAEVSAVFDEIVEFAGVRAYIDTPIKRYSSGMQLRLAFAVAAHLAADTMIIDEVLAVGDAEFQEKCTRAMKDAAGRGRTTLFVSHNMAAVERLCSHAVLLREGRVATLGRAPNVVREYLREASPTGNEAATYVDCGAEDRDARFARIAVHGSHGPAIAQGDDLFVSIDLTIRAPLRRLQVWLALRTVEGDRVAVTCSADVRREWDLEPGSYRATIRLPAPKLLPRTYTLSLRAMRNYGEEIYDDVPDAVSFAVAARDVLGSGVPLLADRGVTWFDTEWDLSRA